MVRTRIAPSPTGEPHIGTAYTALFNFAFAKKNKGEFILRIEDTDRKRLIPNAENKILDSLKWLGLTWDKGPYRQSDRLALYKEAVQILLEKEAAYYCNCTSERLEELRKKQQLEKTVPRYDRKCRNNPPKKGPFVVRLKVPEEGETKFTDLIRGEITFQNKDLDDSVLLKSDGWPTYHLAVVVDDNDMQISHVIRAEEWLSSTPKHILLYKAFGFKLPAFAHLPLLRNPDRSKISKRKNPVSLYWYRQQGFLPEALLNYLGLMGWSMPDEREIFSLEEFINEFDLGRVDPAGPVFDIKKLEWLNGEWIRRMSDQQLLKRLTDYSKRSEEQIKKVLPLVKERLKKLAEFDQLTNYFFEEVKLDYKDLLPKSKTTEEVRTVLESIVLSFKKLLSWDKHHLERMMDEVLAKSGWSKTDLFQTVRYAVTASKMTPPLFETLESVGREKTINRLINAIDILKSKS